MDPNEKSEPPEYPQLEVGIYQIIDDSLLLRNRTDGTGWDWCWADWQREWMDATPNRYAYRCLPLTIANQTGWWIKNPVGFSATWRGRTEPGTIDFRFDAAADVWSSWINSQFGEGIITWNTPFLFRTKPEGSRLLIIGPVNAFKTNAHPLTALIESDWMSMSFTMNWKLMTPNLPVRFEVGEPLFQAIPLLSNVCADLESASVTYQKLSDDPEVARSYSEWHVARKQFHELKARGEVKPDGWQKDYFHGRDMTGREAPEHMTKVKPPVIQGYTAASPPRGKQTAAPPKAASVAISNLTRQSKNLGATNRPETKQAPMSKIPPSGRVRQEPVAEAPSIVVQAGLGRTDTSIADASRISVVSGPQIDDDWRRWIAENLLLEIPPENLIRVLAGRGFDPANAEHEVELALRSPYFRASERLRARIKKRDWLLAVYRKLNRLHPKSDQVERRHKLPRAEFLDQYYSTNRPVILTGMMDEWPAMRKWNLDYFQTNFGGREIEVQNGREAGANYEVEREKYLTKMRFDQYIEKVRTAGVTNDFYVTASNNSFNRSALAGLWNDIVQVPEYLDGRGAQNGFFWFGPAGTITPFHHDLTNNFMAQAIGRKRVRVVPSWDIPLMQNQFHVFSSIDGRTAPTLPHPKLNEPQILDCILGPGEILFLPIGCLHFVEGLDISVTISFTNFVFDNDFASFYTTYHGV